MTMYDSNIWLRRRNSPVETLILHKLPSGVLSQKRRVNFVFQASLGNIFLSSVYNPVVFLRKVIRGPALFILLAPTCVMLEKCTEQGSSYCYTVTIVPTPFFTYANFGLNIFLSRNWSYQFGATSVSWVLDFISISRFYQLCFHFVKKKKKRKGYTKVASCVN